MIHPSGPTAPADPTAASTPAAAIVAGAAPAGTSPTPVSTGPDARTLARAAGLKDLRLPLLEEVDRRRAQLWTLSLLVALAVPVVIVVVGLDAVGGAVSDALSMQNVRLVLLAMLVAVLGYVAEREVALRRLTVLLVEERVLTASLVSRVEELDLLLRATRAMNSALDLQSVLGQIADSAHLLLDAAGVSIRLVDHTDPDRLVVAAVAGDAGVAVGSTQALGEGLPGDAAARRDALLVEAAGGGDGGALVVPMELRGVLVGVISVTSSATRTPFTEFDLRSVSVFAEAAAASISNARSYERQVGRVASLLEADRAKDEFLTLVTHELRTPLTSMIGLMTTLATRGADLQPSQVTTFAAIARDQGWRLDRLVENLLETSRSHRGAVHVTPAAADVSAVVAEAVVGLQRALPDHPITTDIAPGIHREVDVDALLRILDNLLSNAAKYTPAGTPVRVALVEEGDVIGLSVADQGPDADVDVLASLFGKFARGADPHDRGGLGLGLYVVRALAEAHGGRVEVAATDGGGATFHVWLAAVRCAPATG
jgi:two-component system, OmpR family, sensor histidine kinase KdpD